MIQWTKIIWVNNQRRLNYSSPNQTNLKNHGRWIGCSFWEVWLHITHYTIHNAYLTLQNIHYELHTTHYIPFGWHDYCQTDERGQRTEDRWQKTEDRGQRKEDIGQRTEDRGQRKEDRGRRTEDRGQRTEVFKLIWSLSFNWHPMVDQSLGVFLKRLWGRDCVSKVTDCQCFLWNLNLKLTIHHVSMIAEWNYWNTPNV